MDIILQNIVQNKDREKKIWCKEIRSISCWCIYHFWTLQFLSEVNFQIILYFP